MKSKDLEELSWEPMLPSREKIHTTRSAARVLGVSIPTMQQLVESGRIAAWKTSGGHRRIPDGALLQYLQESCTRLGTPDIPQVSSAVRKPLVLIVCDREENRIDKFQRQLLKYRESLKVVQSKNIYDSIFLIAIEKPDLIVFYLEGSSDEIKMTIGAMKVRLKGYNPSIVVMKKNKRNIRNEDLIYKDDDVDMVQDCCEYKEIYDVLDNFVVSQ